MKQIKGEAWMRLVNGGTMEVDRKWNLGTWGMTKNEHGWKKEIR